MEAKNKRNITGVVVSNKMDKTVVVRVETRKWHSKYKKQYKSSAKYKVHDEHNEYNVGDIITCYECRPISKEKRWFAKRKKS